MDKQALGQWGEQEAEKYLLKQGYEILKRNYQKREGEIDLITKDKHMNEIVFVEVKTRRSKTFGEPEEAVTPQKVEKLQKTALNWLESHPETQLGWRIDVIAITQLSKMEITHFKNITL